jgi:hypothetical protein
MEKKYCKFCGEEIHPLRLEILPNTVTCVKCSKEKPKAGRIVTHGTGEEIYTEVEIITREQAEKDARTYLGYSGPLLDDPEDLDVEPEQERLDV